MKVINTEDGTLMPFLSLEEFGTVDSARTNIIDFFKCVKTFLDTFLAVVVVNIICCRLFTYCGKMGLGQGSNLGLVNFFGIKPKGCKKCLYKLSYRIESLCTKGTKAYS